MGVEWRSVTLSEVCEADGLQTGPFGGQLHKEEYTQEGIPVVMPKDMKDGRVLDATIARVPEAKAAALAKHRCLPGDILFGRRGDIGRAALIGDSEAGWLCGTGSLRARLSDSAHPPYLLYAVTASRSVGWLVEHAVGQTMLNLNTEILGRLPILLPPIGEQRKIAAILSSVDEAIEKTQAVIDQVQVVKKGLMQELLTRGIPGRHEKFKQTEIGEIPAEWEVVQLGAIFKLTSGKGISVRGLPQEKTVRTSIPVYGGNGRVGWTDAALVDRPTIIIGRVGEYCGVVHEASEPCWISDNALYAKVFHVPTDLTFIAALLRYVDLSRLRKKTGQPLVTQQPIHDLIVALPTLHEQQGIARRLLTMHRRLETETSVLSGLQTLKQSLMSNLLTGQLRVTP